MKIKRKRNRAIRDTEIYIPTKIDSLVCPFGRVAMIAVRSHLEGSVGAEAAPRMPYEKHCRQWCLTPPPEKQKRRKKKKKGKVDTTLRVKVNEFLRSYIMIFKIYLKPFTKWIDLDWNRIGIK